MRGHRDGGGGAAEKARGKAVRRVLAAGCSVVGTLLIAAVILLCLPLTVPRLLGYEVYAIVSGSMEPAIPTGSLVYAKAAEAGGLEAGDVIVFFGGPDGASVITHRVVENRPQDRQLITRGDANAANDVTPLPYERVLGRVAWSVPGLGLFLPAVTTMQGKLSLLGVLAGAVLLRVLGGRLRADRNED